MFEVYLSKILLSYICCIFFRGFGLKATEVDRSTFPEVGVHGIYDS